MSKKKLYRGIVFHFKDEATITSFGFDKGQNEAYYEYITDGALVVEEGMVVATGEYKSVKKEHDDAKVVDYSGCIITPGFIDTHLHTVQSGIIAAYGEKLLEWLNNYVFPGESIYSDVKKGKKDTEFFLDTLIKNGTTTACGYAPLWYDACDMFFEEVSKRNMRFIAGNNMQDMNSPEYLCLSTKENLEVTEKMIAKWHGKEGRHHYALTPRFAFSCSEELLRSIGDIKKQYPEFYVQTHLNENKSEIAGIKELFPWSESYLDAYDKLGILTDKSIFGHCIYWTPKEYDLMAEKKGIISSCPISNNFLGSGLFNYEETIKHTERITLGTDWGAGHSLSMLQVMGDFYKVALLQDYKMNILTNWFACTLGSAKTLGLDNYIGNFAAGKEADFVILDPKGDDIVNYRFERAKDMYDQLFCLQILGSSKVVKDTYIFGKCMTK